MRRVDNITTKVCNGCKIEKSIDNYWFSGHKRADGTRTYRHLCKDCYRVLGTKQERKRKLKKYGITAEKYEQERVKQNYCCLLCGEHESKQRHGKLVVDHCHDTGTYRGLLCSSCNLGLGKFYDKIEVLKKAIKYVKDSSIRHRNKLTS